MKLFPPPFSRINRVVLVIGIVCLVTTFASVIFVGAGNDEYSSATTVDQSTKARVADRFGRLPLSFEPNKGQTDQAIKFLSRGPGYDLFLTANEAVLTLRKPQRPDSKVLEGSVLRLKMIGANNAPQVEGQDELPGKVNYFAGNNPEKWLRNIPTYRKVYFKGVYPGIDVVYYGNQREFEYDFVVAPGANPKVIKFTVEGADKISLDKTGNLLLDLKHGEVRLKKPVLYQLTDDGSRREVKGNYVIKGNEVRFKVEAFDSGKPLVIDPVLSYSTFLGGGGSEHAVSIAVDSQGSAYVTGSTTRLFPTTAGAFKTSSQSGGAFVSKLDPTGSTLVYSTYLSDSGTTGRSIAVDASGNAYVTGMVSSETDFPTVNGLKTSSNFYKTTDSAATWKNTNTGISGNVTTLAFAANAPNIMYAGALGGPYKSTDGGATWTKTPTTGISTFPQASAMAVDPNNSSVVFVGFVNGGLHKTTDGGNTWNAIQNIPFSFFTVFSIAFDPVTPSTMYVGTSSGGYKSTDSGATWTAMNFGTTPFAPNVRALVIDPTAPATIYAGTLSSGVLKSTNGGSTWTAMNTGMTGTSVVAMTMDPADTNTLYVGLDSFNGINKSTNGAASWTAVNNGVPQSRPTALVVTPAAVYASTDGAGVIKTTNGGTSWTAVNAGLGNSRVPVLAGHPTDPTVLFAGGIAPNRVDAFVTKLNPSGSGLLFSTLLGGSADDLGNGIAVDGTGNIYVVGETFSTNFPTANAFQSDSGPIQNCGNAFVTRLDPAAPSYVFSTYLGGNQCDTANSVAVDTSGNVYVTGRTGSPNFPTANAFQGTIGSDFDSFVTKLTTSGALSYSTFLGGNGNETGFGIAVDVSGNAYVTGSTSSTNFPSLSPIQACNGGFFGFPGDVFVTKLNTLGSALVYSTCLGGSNDDSGRGIAVDSTGNAYVTGITSSPEFPLVAGALRTRSPMFKSIDGAGNWTNDNYGLRASFISQIVVNPSQPSIVYAGTADGVFKSTNGGRTWSPSSNGLTSRQVIAMVIDPLNPSILYVAINDSFSGNSGVYKSTDAGNSWFLRKNGMNNTNLHSLAIDPVTPTTLYAGSGGSPVFKTVDGADSWTPTTSPSFGGVVLAVDPLNHTKVYAGETVASGGGMFRSVDSGATWQPIGLNSTPRSISVSPVTSGLLYAQTNGEGFFKSTDGGDNWTPVSSLNLFTGKIVFDPVNSSTHYLLATQFLSPSPGLHKSTDNGQTWIPMNKGLSSPVATALAIDPQTPSRLHLGSTPAGGDDAFVTKINPAGSALVYSTFIGGTFPNNFPNVNAQGYAIAVDSSGNAYVTGLAFSENFPVTPGSYQPFNRGLTDAFISKLSMSHIISGQVLDGSNAPVSGVEVALSDGSAVSFVTTEGDGSYQFSRLLEGGSYTVSATKPHFTIAPPSQVVNNLTSDQVVNFTATATNAPFFTISGQVTENGVGLAGATVTLSGSQPGLRVTDSNGNYSFELAGGGNYTVTPSILGFTFATPSQTFNNLSAAQTANFAATRQSFVVTNTNSHGPGSLREAMINANATVGADTITFNIPGPGVKVIDVATTLPEITDRVTIDGTTQPGYAGAPLIEINGLSTGSNGFVIKATSVVKGLAIGNFTSGVGLWLRDCDSNVIQGNYIGVDATGTVMRRNSRGILLSNSSNNLIGGTTAAARNVISGNNFSGIELGGSGNFIQGNFIGTNAAGTAAINELGGTGIEISSSPFINNIIGGAEPGAGNLISGNGNGIRTNAPGTVIQGNLIGTDVTGTQAIPNGGGIDAVANNITIGGLTPAARNIISANGQGVRLGGGGTIMMGNYIGTDITGTVALGNSTGVVAGGQALVGGTLPGARNIISGSSSTNVMLGFNNSGSTALLQGNYIGTDVTGTKALSSNAVGISIEDNNHLVGGTAPGAGNLISGNRIGIQLGGLSTAAPMGNTIRGNLIGLDAAGTGAVPNAFQGITISGDAMNSIIGGTESGAANKIAFNGGAGIQVFSGSRNAIRGNSIFSNAALGIDLGPNGVTPNDTTDSDIGANLLQNFPVLTSVQSSGGSTTIQGSLKSTPNTTFQIDFYSSTALDPSGNGEGALFFNTTPVTTDGNGDATINVTFPDALPAGRAITATATDPDGNTSEFSGGDENAATGSLHFSISSFFVIEDVGLATITVQRSGGKVGNLSVNFATADGTAIAGQDYTSTSGTLNFANGETSKTFQVPITEDATTEPDETFTLSLTAPTLEGLGAPSHMLVTIQDRTTVPFVFMNNTSVVEGGPGTTTQALFNLTLSAATGRTVSVNYATANGTAFGSASCGDQGADYESLSGSFTFQPGQFRTVIPVKVCGDTSAEANEFFVVNLSNASNATLPLPQAAGTIVNDDVLELILEDSAPGISQAAALDSYLYIRDPFRVMRSDEILQGTPDKNTRVILFARNLQLNPGESASAVIVRLIGSNNQVFNVSAEDVRAIPGTEFTQVVIKLPETLPPGTCTLTIRAHGRISNIGSFRIAP
ncbi:MAG TPA: SBBP repeat-containing protein [Pyrinomonadaceae bacterium]